MAIFSSGWTASVRPLAAYSFGGNLLPLTPAPSDHDGWEKVVACCSCCPVAGTHVGDRFAWVLTLAGMGVLSLSPRTVFPSLELTSERERGGACSVPSVRRYCRDCPGSCYGMGE